jgi:hypothetical protein
MTFLWFVLTFFFQDPQQTSRAPDEQLRLQGKLAYEHDRHAAIQINDLSGRVNSDADAQALVDAVGDALRDSLPPAWLTAGIRSRVAHAEYQAVSNRLRLIPEQRIADVWNTYVREIGAPDGTVVTAVEIHFMRDADWATSQLFWKREDQTIWTMPNLFAVSPEGKLAEGCRALETLRIFYDLDRFNNLRSVRQRVQKNALVSDELRNRKEATPKHGFTIGTIITSPTDSIHDAERKYVQQHGADHLLGVVAILFDQLFPRSDLS